MRDLLLNQDVTKYLHAGSEDLEVFLNAFNLMPQPLIDTQILAAFCGRPRLGLRLDGGRVFRVALDKSESRTDWLARPLTERQCEYAAADVWYLLPIASQLMAETDRAGWLPAALDECRVMQQRRQEVVDPAEAWRDIGNAGSCVPASWVVCSCWRSGACAKRASATGGKLCGAGRASVERGALYAHQPGRARQPRVIR